MPRVEVAHSVRDREGNLRLLKPDEICSRLFNTACRMAPMDQFE